MKSMHTPGPWRRGSDDLSSPELFCEVYAPNGYLVARCNVGTARGKEGREATEAARANAQLAAAAPELLKALIGVCRSYDRVMRPGAPMPDSLKYAEAVIDKATGSTP